MTPTLELDQAVIEWRCDQCGEPIADGGGYVELPDAEVERCDRETVEWNERHGGSRLLSGAALLDSPRPAHWAVHHRECDPAPDAASYWFDVSRCRDTAALLRWTAHLWSRFPLSDWDDVLRRVSRLDEGPETRSETPLRK
jgi:hypothetical protein